MRLLKVRSRVQPVDPMDTMAVLGDDAPEVDEDLLRAELHQALRDGLRELRPRSREFLVLLMADPPPSYDEVSRRLQMPKGSIGPTRARCLAELRKTAPMRSFLAAHDAMLGR